MMTDRELDQAARDASAIESTVRELVDVVRSLKSDLADAREEREEMRQKLEALSDAVNETIDEIEGAEDPQAMLDAARALRGKATP